MTRLRYTTSVSLVPLTLAFCLAGVSDLLLARDRAIDIPENARATSYGQGWECEQGYRRVKGACNPVKVPDNAYPTGNTYGRVWKCKWGYRQVAEACVAIKVPANAYLKHTGIEWACDHGYRADDNACVAIDVPANAYLTGATYGPGWKCERGYRTVDTTCVAVKLPENAHLDYSGRDWECDPPYRRRQNNCARP